MDDDLPPVRIDYASPDPGKKPVGILRVAGLTIAGLLVVGLLISIMLPSLNRSPVTSNRVKCASNLRQIGQAILLYTNDFHGRYPDTFGDLLLTEDITSSVFDCPSTNDTPAVGATTQAAIVNMNTPGHCSYIYMGKGLSVQTVQPTMVVAYEPPSNHGKDGTNVLFGDGHVEFIGMPQATVILNQVKAGVWPVWFPAGSATMPSTTSSATGASTLRVTLITTVASRCMILK